MVNSLLDDVKEFVDTIDATTTINHEGNIGIVSKVGSGNRILIKEPQLVSSDTYSRSYIFRYRLELEFDSEINLITALNNLIVNIDYIRRKVAISGYSKPDRLWNVELVSQGEIWKPKMWRCDVYIECEWSAV